MGPGGTLNAAVKAKKLRACLETNLDRATGTLDRVRVAIPFCGDSSCAVQRGGLCTVRRGGALSSSMIGGNMVRLINGTAPGVLFRVCR